MPPCNTIRACCGLGINTDHLPPRPGHRDFPPSVRKRPANYDKQFGDPGGYLGGNTAQKVAGSMHKKVAYKVGQKEVYRRSDKDQFDFGRFFAIDTKHPNRQHAKTWNRDTVGYPSVLVACKTEDDVIAAVKHAAKLHLAVGVASGRHSHCCMPDDAVVCEMSHMRNVEVDEIRQQATVQGGCLADDIQRAARKARLVTTLNSQSNTGVGEIFSGGHGFLERKHGMTIDSILSARVVLANGEVKHCSKEEEPDLFWAIRGGGGNFGVYKNSSEKSIDRDID